VAEQESQLKAADKVEEEVAKLQEEVARLKACQGKSVRKRSSRMLWGLPLYDIAFGPDPEKGEKVGHARGVIAIGEFAFGIFAFGIVSRGVVTFGVLSLGVLAVGVASGALGFAFGTLAIAPVAFGVQAIGIVAFGVSAIGIVADGVSAIGIKTGFVTGL